MMYCASLPLSRTSSVCVLVIITSINWPSVSVCHPIQYKPYSASSCMVQCTSTCIIYYAKQAQCKIKSEMCNAPNNLIKINWHLISCECFRWLRFVAMLLTVLFSFTECVPHLKMHTIPIGMCPSKFIELPFISTCACIVFSSRKTSKRFKKKTTDGEKNANESVPSSQCRAEYVSVANPPVSI